jgi:hypothetical protein
MNLSQHPWLARLGMGCSPGLSCGDAGTVVYDGPIVEECGPVLGAPGLPSHGMAPQLATPPQAVPRLDPAPQPRLVPQPQSQPIPYTP